MSTQILFTKHAWEDYLFWKQCDEQKLKRINELIKDIQRSPFSGVGKPEALKFSFAGFWSRRIDQEHRLVYKVDGQTISIVQCRYHYE